MKPPSWTQIKKIVLDILFPAVCLACDAFLKTEFEINNHLCAGCRNQMTTRDTLLCSACGARLPENIKICHRDAPFMLAAATDYENAIVRSLIFRLKYERLKEAAAPLTALLSEYLSNLDFDWDGFVVAPVPLHPKRLRERGWNQAELLSNSIAALLKLPHLPGALRRVRYEEPQAKIRTRAEREINMLNAFEADKNIAGQNILLVDDVITTGATLRAAAAALKTAGCRRVIALVAARRS